MQLSKIIKNLKPQYRSHFFSNLSSNSKDCKKDDIFFSIKGKRHNGNKFIKDAIRTNYYSGDSPDEAVLMSLDI